MQSNHARRPNGTATFSVCIGNVRVSGLRHGTIEEVSSNLLAAALWNWFVLSGLVTVIECVSMSIDGIYKHVIMFKPTQLCRLCYVARARRQLWMSFSVLQRSDLCPTLRSLTPTLCFQTPHHTSSVVPTWVVQAHTKWVVLLPTWVVPWWLLVHFSLLT